MGFQAPKTRPCHLYLHRQQWRVNGVMSGMFKHYYLLVFLSGKRKRLVGFRRGTRNGTESFFEGTRRTATPTKRTPIRFRRRFFFLFRPRAARDFANVITIIVRGSRFRKRRSECTFPGVPCTLTPRDSILLCISVPRTKREP